ncbi:poly A polymerase [Carnobacterium sp. AT7]|uniref:CCA tRNA nucleotidyltransferase n=1 Tax=Carnobacterium sp. AT7 TaxID=333990 RepID=UPI00015F1168|nr:CCA tRNA nucleotidyltransferase [Carnobacterium sp. AT7]EDP67707.1 poly A polymerase [Carnobacterium sp. AT7]
MILFDPQFKQALPIIDKIEEAGFEAYFVGGSVRDTLLKETINDVDIATSAKPDEIKQIFQKTIDVGIEHGTVMVLWKDATYEITTFRTESTYQDFRRPDNVEFVRSLKEDLKRRDFTINALAMNRDGQIIDYFEGQTDLEKKLIKAVGNPEERFFEDALRMMRGVRFVSQLNFEMDRETELAIQKNHPLLEKIAIERIQVEFTKLLLGSGRKKGLELFIRTNLFYYCPGLKDQKKALEEFAKLECTIDNRIVAWTMLIYYLSKSKPASEAEPFLRAWKCSKKEIAQVRSALFALEQRLNDTFNSQVLYQVGLPIALDVEKIMACLGHTASFERIHSMYQGLPIYNKKEIKINGNDLQAALNRKPGKWLGDLMIEMETAILAGELVNEKQAILEWATHKEK